MAKETIVLLKDDIDGTDAAEEVTFALRGVEYAIDLSEKNVAALDKVFEKYIKKATPLASIRVPRGGRKTKSKGSGAKAEVAAIRAWATEAGHTVSSRGRISGAVRDAYHIAQGLF